MDFLLRIRCQKYVSLVVFKRDSWLERQYRSNYFFSFFNYFFHQHLPPSPYMFFHLYPPAFTYMRTGIRIWQAQPPMIVCAELNIQNPTDFVSTTSQRTLLPAETTTLAVPAIEMSLHLLVFSAKCQSVYLSAE